MTARNKQDTSARVPIATGLIPLFVAAFSGLMCVVITGAFFHPIYSLAAPVACQGGEMEIEAVTSTTEEGGVGYGNQITCVDGASRSDISISATVIAALILTVIFAAIFIPL